MLDSLSIPFVSTRSKSESEAEPQLSFAALWSGKVKSPRRPPAGFGAPKQSQAASAIETMPERRIWSVRMLVADVRQHIERAYDTIWVEGEISNLRAAPSGHLYFTLKDGEAQLPVVLFRREAMLLRFRPEDGLAVLVRGKVSVYESRGQMQLVAETLEPRGAGALQIAFEQLRDRLSAEGLFDPECKQTLPAFPRCIGVITSPAGAVIQDILNIVARRHARLNILIYPALMQGAQAAGEVAAGIRWFNDQSRDGNSVADILVIARGGGSIEDLAPFNDEALARTIAASRLPIVSAIGHETDFTIADFVADLRAPSPSAAAEIVTAAQHRIEEHLEQLEQRVARAIRYQIMQARQCHGRLSADAAFARMRDVLGRRQQRVDELRFRIESAWSAIGRASTQRVRLASERLLRQDVRQQLVRVSARLQGLDQRLAQVSRNMLQSSAAKHHTAYIRLQSLSPMAVLSRGYALVFNSGGELVKSADQAAIGDTISARLADGSLTAEITASTLPARE